MIYGEIVLATSDDLRPSTGSGTGVKRERERERERVRESREGIRMARVHEQLWDDDVKGRERRGERTNQLSGSRVKKTLKDSVIYHQRCCPRGTAGMKRGGI